MCIYQFSHHMELPQILPTRQWLARFTNIPPTAYPFNEPYLVHLGLGELELEASRATIVSTPHHPPYSMAHHPIEAFYGRNLSNSALPLPVMREYGSQNVRDLFVRRTQDLTDMGFGPGITIHPAIVPEYERAVEYNRRLNFTPDPVVVTRNF
jgi:hypothetical protein